MRRTIDATVFVKVMYKFEYGIGSWTGVGTGFFVDPGGYILTNHHVISDEVEVPLRDGTTVSVKAEERRIDVVVDSGSEDERVLTATLVGSDKKADLALLKVPYKSSEYVRIVPLAELELAKPIWAVGFPFGGLLSADTLDFAHAQSNPEVSLSSGMVASLRRNTRHELRLVQTDAALNPGNSGGPLVDENGLLAGVVSFGIDGGTNIGFGIAPKIVQDFILRYAVDVDVQPRMILDPPQPLAVTVFPVFEGLDVAAVSARLHGHDIATTEVMLEHSLGGFRGTLVVGETTAESGEVEGYRAEIVLTDSEGHSQVQRTVRLGTSARAMPARPLLLSPTPIASPTPTSVQGKGAGDLTSIASSVEISRSRIDNNEVEIATGRKQDERLYEGVFGLELRTSAAAYDRLTDEIIDREKQLTAQTETRYPDSYRVKRLTDELLSLRAEKERQITAIRDGGICRCPDGTWHHQDHPPCNSCYRP